MPGTKGIICKVTFYDLVSLYIFFIIAYFYIYIYINFFRSHI